MSARLGGIFANGYGVIPAIVMRDASLTPEAKVIYCYLSIHSSSKIGEYFLMPTEKKLCDQLSISHARYLSHRKQLEDKGYIAFASNRDINNSFSQYRCVLRQDVPSHMGSNVDLDAAITQEGILSRGYGLLPRQIITDPSLSICAKAYYAYACIYAAANTRADRVIDLSRTIMQTSLMSQDLQRKYEKELIGKGYILISRSRIKGCTSCVLLLYPHQQTDNNGRTDERELVFESYDPSQKTEQASFNESLFNESKETQRQHTGFSMDEIEKIVRSAVANAIQSIEIHNESKRKDSFADFNTTENQENSTHIYYPNITINININSDLIDQKGTEKNLQDKKELQFKEKKCTGESISYAIERENTGTFPRSIKIGKNEEEQQNRDFGENNTAEDRSNKNGKRLEECIEEAFYQIEGNRYESSDWDNTYEQKMMHSIAYVIGSVYAMDGVGEVFIGGKKMPAHSVEEVFREVKAEHVDNMLYDIEKHGEEEKYIANKEAYLRTCLYKARINSTMREAFMFKNLRRSIY